MDRRNQTCWRK